ncbi:hypothetical protein HYALB_00000188 [Hymenoscyphus albidus]|uniref:Tetratricopeptide repeat protein 36 n=1 Tax=Hymenoscyphus albidus TaxID=595503 RepID=A0A9N9LV88_9HELO|nr:hypothetical protein HYALB_00000188 [Hymenoscyphus albidus]
MNTSTSTSTPSLTPHDLSILSKIADPESTPSPLLLSPSLPKDPHITTPTLYQSLTTLETTIIHPLRATELQLAGFHPTLTGSPSATQQYQTAISALTSLINEHPTYASARNNRAQALRRVYGDGVLVQQAEGQEDGGIEVEAERLCKATDTQELSSVSKTLLLDLKTAIHLLTPPPYSPISPTAAKTLSLAYTQRGAIYLRTAKLLSIPGSKLIFSSQGQEGGEGVEEAKWETIDFEEAAARDFMWGGRYGNEVSKALAVATNPTAKLCGSIVREAMVREFGGQGV